MITDSFEVTGADQTVGEKASEENISQSMETAEPSEESTNMPDNQVIYRLVKVIFSEGFYTTETTYGEAGNRMKETMYLIDGSLLVTTEWEYDPNLNLMREISKNAKGIVTNETLWEYDKVGNQVKELELDSEGQPTKTTLWEYDEAGNMIHSICYEGADVLYTETYEYVQVRSAE